MAVQKLKPAQKRYGGAGASILIFYLLSVRHLTRLVQSAICMWRPWSQSNDDSTHVYAYEYSMQHYRPYSWAGPSQSTLLGRPFTIHTEICLVFHIRYVLPSARIENPDSNEYCFRKTFAPACAYATCQCVFTLKLTATLSRRLLPITRDTSISR